MVLHVYRDQSEHSKHTSNARVIQVLLSPKVQQVASAALIVAGMLFVRIGALSIPLRGINSGIGVVLFTVGLCWFMITLYLTPD